MRQAERSVMLTVVDTAWKDHLLALDHLKEGINLRGYGQRDPLNEYKRESYELFEQMKTQLEDKIVSDLFRIEPMSEEEQIERRRRMIEEMRRRLRLSGAGAAPVQLKTVQHKQPKVGRNDPCPCGSGKKYKKCHGAAGR